MSSEGNMSIWPPQNAVKGRVNHNPISFLEGCILLKGDSQTFVEALLKGSSKQMSFLYLVFTNFGQKMFFLPFSRFFLHQKNLASFLVILVQVCFASQESQKSLYRGLPHHLLELIFKVWKFQRPRVSGKFRTLLGVFNTNGLGLRTTTA